MLTSYLLSGSTSYNMDLDKNHISGHKEEEQYEELTVELDTEDLQSYQLARKSLVGKILADKPLNKGVVRSILCKAWGENGVAQITDTEVNLFLFTFSDKKDVLHVIQKGSWIGEVQEVENPEVDGRLLRTFIRVIVLIDITAPLVTGCWVPRKDLPRVWIFFKYEKLQSLCYNCGILGHEQKNCTRMKVMSVIDHNVPRFSSQEQGFWRSKGEGSGAKAANTTFSVLEDVGGNRTVDLSDNAAQKAKGKGVLQVDCPPLGVKDNFSCNFNSHNQQTEFIGLPKNLIILDYPSPTKNKYQGANLSPTQIRKCRKFISKHTASKKNEVYQDYFVEFPNEEKEDCQGSHPITLQQETESQLIVGWNNSLSLKRYREDAFVDATHLFKDLWEQQKKAKMMVVGELSDHSFPHMAKLNVDRGLAASSTIRELKELCSKYKPSLVFLSETRAVESKIKRIRRQLRFENSFCVNPISLSGGLCILWNRPLVVSVSHHSPNFIHAFVEDLQDVKEWKVAFLYGNPTFQQRRHLWGRIQALRTSIQRPWTIMGDFNELLYPFEKDGLRPHQQHRIDLFRIFVSDMGLMDLELKGCKFTWFSNPRNDFVIREKLDRILVNWEWRSLFPNALAMVVPTCSSDHTPIIFWPKPRLKSGKIFKFEAFLEEHEELEFGDNWEKIQDLKGQIELLRKQENIYWAQRSRIKWLHHGDRNSKFFHASTIQRRDRNKLFRLRDTVGNWVKGQNDIEKLVLDHYQESVFVAGRQIQDNLLIVQEVFHGLNNRRGADDSILFEKVDVQEVLQLTRILNIFSKASGQRINLAKSGVIFGKGVPPSQEKRNYKFTAHPRMGQPREVIRSASPMAEIESQQFIMVERHNSS
ncbi:Zinc finger, CCHC-type [Sesbania bispinosa]|nr:Zinc finger, CCHC-type [Sesbania bispinosa]